MPDIKIQKIDYKTGDKPFYTDPHTHEVYEFFYFSRGHATHCIDFNDYSIKDDTAFIVSKNQFHYITAGINTHNTGFFISFDDE